MNKKGLSGCVSVFVVWSLSAAAYAQKVTYGFAGTATDAGVIAGVSASVGDTITDEFS